MLQIKVFSYDVEVEKGNGKTCEEGGGGGVLGSLSELDFCISLLAIYSHQFYKQPARVTLPTRWTEHSASSRQRSTLMHKPPPTSSN